MVLPNYGRCRIGRFSKKLESAKRFHMAAEAWCLTKPPLGCWQPCFCRYYHTPFYVCVCIARSSYLRRRTRGWGRETRYSRWRDEAFILECSGINNGKEHSSLFSAPCFCPHALTAAPSPPRPSFSSYFLYHTIFCFHVVCLIFSATLVLCLEGHI